MLKLKIKQFFCNHLELGKERYYYEDVEYNNFFNTVQAMEYSYKCCKNCGKRIETNIAKWVSLKGIEEKIIKDHELNKKSKLI